MKTQIISATIAVSTLAIVASVSKAQIITNGSFEDGLNGWSVSGNANVDHYPDFILAGYEVLGYTNGTSAAVFSENDSPPNAVLTQTFPTVPGERYALQFGFGSQQGCVSRGPATNGLSVEVMGGRLLLSNVVTAVGIYPTLNIVAQRLYFWSDATNCTLTFRDVSLLTECQGGHLDNVSVEWVGPALSIRLSQVELCWYSQTNQIWQVQYRSTLTTNSWTNLGAPISGTSPLTCTNDFIATGSPQRFYQVIRVP